MPNYNYVAISDLGKKIKGTIIADNPDDLGNKLQGIGLEVLDFKILNNSSFSFSFSSSITNKDIILLCTHFEQLDNAGVPITESIQDLRDSVKNNRFRDLMQDVYESVKSGKVLSEALAEHPKIFDEVFVGLIHAGEKTGDLGRSFKYLSEHLKWSADIRRKAKKAIRYPIMLLVVLMITMSIMMIFVIPKLTEFLTQQNFELPFYTKALISLSQIFQSSWYIIIFSPIMLIIFHKLLYKFNNSYAYTIDSILLKLPFIGLTMLKIDIARFSQFFSITFNSGIDVIDCFDVVKKVVHNRVIKKTLSDIQQSISDGNNISQSLKNSGEFPSLVVRMFQIGESTGNMSKSLKNVKYFYDQEVNDAVDSIVSIIQPILTLIMGGLLLWISLSVFGPLYSSFGDIR
jgi:type IV pilus assembly protein PilC